MTDNTSSDKNTCRHMLNSYTGFDESQQIRTILHLSNANTSSLRPCSSRHLMPPDKHAPEELYHRKEEASAKAAYNQSSDEVHAPMPPKRRYYHLMNKADTPMLNGHFLTDENGIKYPKATAWTFQLPNQGDETPRNFSMPNAIETEKLSELGTNHQASQSDLIGKSAEDNSSASDNQTVRTCSDFVIKDGNIFNTGDCVRRESLTKYMPQVKGVGCNVFGGINFASGGATVADPGVCKSEVLNFSAMSNSSLVTMTDGEACLQKAELVTIEDKVEEHSGQREINNNAKANGDMASQRALSDNLTSAGARNVVLKQDPAVNFIPSSDVEKSHQSTMELVVVQNGKSLPSFEVLKTKLEELEIQLENSRNSDDRKEIRTAMRAIRTDIRDGHFVPDSSEETFSPILKESEESRNEHLSEPQLTAKDSDATEQQPEATTASATRSLISSSTHVNKETESPHVNKETESSEACPSSPGSSLMGTVHTKERLDLPATQLELLTTYGTSEQVEDLSVNTKSLTSAVNLKAAISADGNTKGNGFHSNSKTSPNVSPEITSPEATDLKVSRPYFEAVPQDLSVTEGEDASFECSISARLLSSISWYKDDDSIPSEDEDFKQTFDGRVAKLYIAETYLDDAAIYRCTARNAAGDATVTAKLVVNEAASSDSAEEEEERNEDGPPVFSRTLVDLSICEGQAALLECSVSASQEPIVMWYKNLQILRSGTEYQQTYDGKTARLRIGEVNGEDAGKYECLARNANGKASSTCRLTVQGNTELSSNSSPEGPSSPVATIPKAEIKLAKRSQSEVADVKEIEDEDLLQRMLSQTEDLNLRGKIRSRLQEIRDKKIAELEAKRVKLRLVDDDPVQRRLRLAEEEKQRKMEEFQKKAQDSLRQRVANAEAERKLQRSISTDSEQPPSMSSEARQSFVGQSGIDRQRTLSSGGEETKSLFGSPAKTKALPVTKSGKPLGGIASLQYTLNQSPGRQWSVPGSPSSRAHVGNSSPGSNPGRIVTVQRSATTIKQRLIDWCRAMVKDYENVNITNFSSSWNDGLAFCALIHHFYPDAFDYSQLNPRNCAYNFQLAFDMAEKCADIAPLLEVEDMVRMKNPDWKCVFTYVQSIYRRFALNPPPPPPLQPRHLTMDQDDN